MKNNTLLCINKNKATVYKHSKSKVMKLITKEIEQRLAKYPIYSQDSKIEKTIVCKFFLANFTWYVLEAEKINSNDFEFYGIVDNAGEKEFGYFTLAQLEAVRVWGCMRVERDLYFRPQTINSREFMSSSSII